MDPRYERFQKLVPRLRGKRRGYWYRFEGGATEEAIAAAERELGVGLPSSFRWFLREFGATSLCATIFGVGSSGSRTIPEVTREQCYARPPLPRSLVVFGVESWRQARSQSGRLAYTYDCFDTSRDIDGEYPVVIWEPHPLWRRRRRRVGWYFLDWLERKLDEAEADDLPMEPPNGSGTDNRTSGASGIRSWTGSGAASGSPTSTGRAARSPRSHPISSPRHPLSLTI
jgi:hypothetical protein